MANVSFHSSILGLLLALQLSQGQFDGMAMS